MSAPRYLPQRMRSLPSRKRDALPTPVEVLDDAVVRRRVKRGHLTKLDMSAPSPVDAAAVARLRERIAQRRKAPVEQDDDGEYDPEDGADL